MDWDLRPDGNVKLCPLAGYQTLSVADVAVGLRLEAYEDEAALAAGRTVAWQSVMKPAEARELGLALIRKADALEASSLAPRN